MLNINQFGQPLSRAEQKQIIGGMPEDPLYQCSADNFCTTLLTLCNRHCGLLGGGACYETDTNESCM